MALLTARKLANRAVANNTQVAARNTYQYPSYSKAMHLTEYHG